MSFTYYCNRMRDGKSIAYWSGFLHGDRWLWDLIRSDEATCEGQGFPCRIVVKAKYVLPHFAHLAGADEYGLQVPADLERFEPPFDDEELVEIEAWDQS